MGLLLALGAPPDTPFPSGAAAAGRALIATIIVLALVVALAWLLRRGWFAGAIRRPGPIRIETALPLGERRSLVVVAVEGRRLLLGLTPMQVSLVTELKASGGFEQALDRSLTPPRERSS